MKRNTVFIGVLILIVNSTFLFAKGKHDVSQPENIKPWAKVLPDDAPYLSDTDIESLDVSLPDDVPPTYIPLAEVDNDIPYLSDADIESLAVILPDDVPVITIAPDAETQVISDVPEAPLIDIPEVDTDLALAYFNSGTWHKNRGNYDEAIWNYTRAISVDPNYAKAYYNRGFSYHNKGAYDWAIADYSAALNINQNYTEALHSRGTVYKNKGDYFRAIADYTTALNINPNDTLARLSLDIVRKEQVCW
jgi:tetratricopeptide (TPR) repeat protein